MTNVPDQFQQFTRERLYNALQGAMDATAAILEGLEAALAVSSGAAIDRPQLMEAITRGGSVKEQLDEARQDVAQLIQDHGEGRYPEICRQVEAVLRLSGDAVRHMGDVLETADLA